MKKEEGKQERAVLRHLVLPPKNRSRAQGLRAAQLMERKKGCAPSELLQSPNEGERERRRATPVVRVQDLRKRKGT